MSIQQLAIQYQDILHKEWESERQRLNDYQVSLCVLVERHAKAKPRPSKPLTIPAIFGRSHDENFISDYLAYVLNPARNGIGEGPLAALLHLCDIDAADLPLSEVVIYREYALEGGRIDLLLEWEDVLVLGIESKIFSPEGTGQTAYYAQVINKLFQDTSYRLVYLTRGGGKAGSSKFQPISYEQLLSTFQNVLLPSGVGARQRVLWEDFLEHLEVYIVMAEPEHFEFSEKAQLYIAHQAMIRDLETAFKREWGEAVGYIERQLYPHLEGGPWKTYFSRNKDPWHQVFKPHWVSSVRSVHYEYSFSLAYLQRHEIEFMVDVELERSGKLLALFDHYYPAFETEYRQRDILYRPPNRRIAIAYKTYPITRDIDQIVQTFMDAFDEFRFLEQAIDQVLAEFDKS